MDENSQTNALTERPVKAIIFDLMGTCVDWHTAMKSTLDNAIAASNVDPFTALPLHWRRAFFDEIHARFENGLPQEDIDETHRRTLLALLERNGRTMTTEDLETCVKAWHRQTGGHSCLGVGAMLLS